MKNLLLLFVIASVASVARAQSVAPSETLIKNATVLTVTRGTLTNTDVLLRNGKIAAVGKNLNASANARVIDATGKFMMPGIIDAHVHINEPGRTDWEGFDTATKAAAAGGITTVIDMPLNSSPVTRC